MPGEGELNPYDEDRDIPVEVRKDNRTLMLGGALSLIGGVGIFTLSNFLPFWEGMLGVAVTAGIVGLGIGIFKSFGKIFRKKTLNLPSLQIRRKTERHSRANVHTMDTTGPQKNRLAKSLKDKVFLGVAGGLAEQSGISSAMIRMLFIGAFAFSGGSAALLYLALGFFLPTGRR